jgi:gliding motility-associated-like protein
MYFLSDGTTYDDCNFSHSFTSAGEQRITQVVSNEYGCTATAIGYVDVGGLLFFAPNAFTPDGDGINDVWLPVATGIKEYELDIFDRWGTIIFSTSDVKEPWLGQIRGGNHFANNGVYYYQVKLRDLIDEAYTFDGYITIVR